MCFVIYLLMIMHAVSVIAAQGSSCHYKNGCSPKPDVCSVPPPVCERDWFGQYCQMHNIVRGKPASQSSTWTDNTGTYDASKAVDGDVNTHHDHGSCSHTDELNSGHASWQVLLSGTFLISRITIYLRDDNIGHNEAMEILVSGNTCRTLTVTDIRDSSTHLITNPATLSCTEPTEGDNVTIVMAGPYLALCEVQVFGKEKESCQCSKGCLEFPNIACSTPSSGPVCKSPWFGSFCQMENIAFQKTATQSSTYYEDGLYCAAYAVDGNTDTDFRQRSCSYTNEADTSVVKASWQVLLDGHQMFNISRIRIFLRNDPEDHNKNMTVLVNGGVCNAVSGTTLQEKVRSGSNPFDVTCTHVMKGNNVTITMTGRFLTLCEIQVFVCSDGWFGDDCDKQCQCQNTSEVCDKDTGYCQSGCAVGKQGQGCQDCVDGYYGGNCLQQCGSCKDGTHCNKSNGECPQGCKTNFQTPYCKDCEDGYYGGNCLQQCGSCKDGTHCNKSNGECPQGCKTNIQTPYCKDCEDGYYGGNCLQQCGSCKDGTHCNKSNGECPQGCKTNIQTPYCKDCEDGYYGGNCLQQCGSCKDGTHCNKSNGECPQGCKTNIQTPYCKDCEDGYYGGNCLQQCGSCKDGTHCNKSNGECPQGCKTNIQTPYCKDCVDGYYGGNCLQQCGSCKDGTHCNKSNGECPQGCKTNFQTPYCKDCEDGYYGGNCLQQCGSCKDGTHCNKSNGECPQGCKTNFQTPYCKDCEDGYYGGNCLQQCGSCKDGTHCNKSNGECPQGCKTNIQTPYCKDCVDGNCLQQCGSCKDGTHCNKSNGECPQECKTNFQTPYCKVCKDGLFGTACSKHCKCRNSTEICDKVRGNCRSGCPAGIRGSGCQEECADYTYGINCSGVCSCLNQCEVCEKVTGECQTGYHTTTAEKSTAIPLKNENIGHKTDVRFIVVCCLMVVLIVYSAAATTLVFRLKRKNAKTQAELEKQYMSLETRGESSVYDVIDGTHTYSNGVQPENSDYENTTRRVMKRDEHSL